MEKTKREQNFEEQFNKIRSSARINFDDWSDFEDWYFKYSQQMTDVTKSRKKWRERALKAEKTLKEIRDGSNN